MSGLWFRVPPIGMPVVMIVEVIVTSSTHFGRRDRALDTGHGFQHAFQSVAVETDAVFPVHFFRALRLVPPVHRVVYHVMVMCRPQLRVSHHVDV